MEEYRINWSNRSLEEAPIDLFINRDDYCEECGELLQECRCELNIDLQEVF